MLPHSLQKIPFVERFYSHYTTGSTNDIARSMRDFPEEGIFVVQADRQTAGRGRTGASFFSDSEGGLWASIVTQISSINEHFVHNRALSLAVCEAVERITGRAGACAIKWPNDVLWGDRKFCGILLENHLVRSDILVAGFGIDIKMKTADFPPDLRETATSLFIETGREYSRREVLENVLERYNANLIADLQKTHYSYAGRLYGLGRIAEVDGSRGVFAGVEMDGRLKLMTAGEPAGGPAYFVSGRLTFPKQEQDHA